MPIDRFPIGLEMDVSYPQFQVSLTMHDIPTLPMPSMAKSDQEKRHDKNDH